MQKSICLLAAGAALAAGCGRPDTRSTDTPVTASTEREPKADDCLPGGQGYLKARLRGAIDVDLDWTDAQMRCEGGSRPDGAGLRVSIAGPLPDTSGFGPGRTLRFVFGIDAPAAEDRGSALPTNLTAIVEGSSGEESQEPTHRPALYATRGDGKCTADSLTRTRLESASPTSRDWRVEARGFCLDPALPLDGDSGLLVSTFDFAARISLETP